MKYFLLAFSMILVLAACNKNPTVTANRENIMRSKKWKLTGGTLTVKKPNGQDTILKYLDYIPECYKDDYLKFDSMHFGKQYVGGTTCSPADPEYTNFTWRLWNNDKYIDLYDGFNRIWAVSTSIKPYYFRVKSTSPLAYDTLIGRLDTIPGFIKQFIVLDTIRELRYDSSAIPDYDIYGAEITEFTEASFKLNFSFKTTRLDSTGGHAGPPENLPPIVREDTAHYSLIYTSF